MSNQQRPHPNQRRKPQPKRPVPVDIWRKGGPLPEVEPIAIPHDVGALLRSLGDPPMNGGATVGHYFNEVIERASALAVALAVSADLLAQPDNN